MIRQSELMTNVTYAVVEALEALDLQIMESNNIYFDSGIKFERERIIKLLEQVMATSPLTADLIELIKGEQK